MLLVACLRAQRGAARAVCRVGGPGAIVRGERAHEHALQLRAHRAQHRVPDAGEHPGRNTRKRRRRVHADAQVCAAGGLTLSTHPQGCHPRATAHPWCW